MTPVGETLRRERLKRNLDLEEISRELKISPRFLKAIEDDQFDKLPGGVFAKSFVRQYARLLGLDEEQICRVRCSRSWRRSPNSRSCRERKARTASLPFGAAGGRVADRRRPAIPLVRVAVRRRSGVP